MKVHIKNIKGIAYACFALAIFVGMHLLSVYIFAVHRFVISYDKQISTGTQSDITAYINTYPTHSLSFAQLEQSLQQKFACITAMQAQALPDGIIKLHIHTLKPLYRCNDTFVLTAANSIIKADYYNDINQLPTLHIPLTDNQQKLSKQTFAYLTALQQLTPQQDAVFFKQPHDIHVTLQDQYLKIKCHEYATLTQDTLNQCIQIAKEQRARWPHTKKILADIRFDNLIIVSKIKELGEKI